MKLCFSTNLRALEQFGMLFKNNKSQIKNSNFNLPVDGRDAGDGVVVADALGQ